MDRPALSNNRFNKCPLSQASRHRKITFLGTFVPRRCGIATFTNDLARAVSGSLPGAEISIVALGEHPGYPADVIFSIAEQDLGAYHRAAAFLNRAGPDVLCIQHEFGIFGGPAGSYLIPLLRDLEIPIVTTLHTVLHAPDIEQRRVMEEIALRSSYLVVMAQRGAEILQEIYDVDPSKIAVIPHGIPDFSFDDTASVKSELGYAGRTVLLTFGLLGPGKGIEYAIRSIPEIAAKHPDILYLILGATHPNLLAREGERYREGLERLATELGVAENVRFDDRYVPAGDLTRFLTAADIYLTPYPNEAQITSGTLAQAVGAGKAVVSTPFWHAQELLSEDAGILVPSRDCGAIASAINALLDHPEHMAKIRKEAFRRGRCMVWERVADLYKACFEGAAHEARSPTAVSRWRAQRLPVLKLDHIERMTDDTGMLQHATFNVPNYREGYCTDDNARALLLALQIEGEEQPRSLPRMTSTYLAFLAAAFNPGNARFRNFMSYSREWREEAGSEDSHGRAIWATGMGAAIARCDGWRLLCLQLFRASLPALESFTSPRAWAFALLGVHEYLRTYPGDLQAHRIRLSLVGLLIDRWNETVGEGWRWFEKSLAYDNARLSQALVLTGACLPETRAMAIGLDSLEWLVKTQTAGFGHFRPIANNGFHSDGGERAVFDQQPLEAHATVSACLAAWRSTGALHWLREAERAFDWYMGRNDVGLSLYDPETGGCCDGLEPDHVNGNQGAESSLAFALSLVELREALAARKEPLKRIA
jgi:glycosyltransferase involved in cell wall biosynthesis